MRKEGFTLIELMVAMGLFVTVITVIVSLFLQASRSERVVARRAAAIDNVSLAVEQMAREVRTGYDFPTITDPGGRKVTELTFTNYRGQRVVYRMNVNAIEKSINGGTTFSRLTSENIKINRLDFLLKEKSNNGLKNFTPRVTILAEAVGPFEGTFNLETTVSSRLIYYRP